jgi:osmotically-inducible protein OsmY
MKSVIILVIGILIGALGWNLYLKRDAHPLPATPVTTKESESGDDSRTLGERAGDTASDVKKTLAAKAKEWRLTPEDIKRELKDGSAVVREKAGTAGGKIADVRIVTVIKSKYVVDRELSASDIKVECKSGHVTLTGTVASPDMVAKAVLQAMDTDGVVNVTSNLKATTL